MKSRKEEKKFVSFKGFLRQKKKNGAEENA